MYIDAILEGGGGGCVGCIHKKIICKTVASTRVIYNNNNACYSVVPFKDTSYNIGKKHE